jgi:hypothetical protein
MSILAGWDRKVFLEMEKTPAVEVQVNGRDKISGDRTGRQIDLGTSGGWGSTFPDFSSRPTVFPAGIEDSHSFWYKPRMK